MAGTKTKAVTALSFDDAALLASSPDPAVAIDPAAEVRLLQPESSDLWVARVALPAGATILWSGSRADHVVVADSGRVGIDGIPVEQGSVVVVEAGRQATLTATEEAVLYWFGTERAPVFVDAERGSGQPPTVHVIPAQGSRTRTMDYQDRQLRSAFFLDGTCPTCSASLLAVEADGSLGFPPHEHSSDEVILLLDGELRIGARAVRAGSALFIPGDRRYGLQSSGPFRFLNYRPCVSSITVERGGEPELELASARGYGPGGDIVSLGERS